MVDHIQALHQEVKTHLEEANQRCKDHVDTCQRAKEFQIGHLVIVHLRKSSLPSGTHNKLTNKTIDPLPILECIVTNAYYIDLPSSTHINFTFYVSDIVLYFAPDEFYWAT